MKTLEIENVNDLINEKTLIRHGGCARIFVKQNNQDKCYKIYRKSFTNKKRDIVKKNYTEMKNHERLIKKAGLVIPDTIYTDYNEKLLGIRMKNYPYGNLMNAKNKWFYSKEYPMLVINFLNSIKKANELGVVITDLKESNVLVSPDFNILLIDNDFSFLHNDEKVIQNNDYLTNVFGKAYINTFGEDASVLNFNDYSALYIVCKLLLENYMIDELVNHKGKFTLKSLKSMQRFIQSDKSISTYLRNEFKNLSTGDTRVKINDDIINEINDVLEYKYKKRR